MIKVNQVEISEADIGAEMQYHPAADQRQAQIKAAESLIIGELLTQRAKTIGLKWPSKKVTPAEEERALDLLIEQEVAIPRASDAECQHYFYHNRDKFHSTPILEVRHILLAAAPDDPQERDQMAELAKQLLIRLQANPACFDEIVMLHSACPSKAQGGNLGQISKGQTVPEFEKALLVADQGLVSYPIESRYGFHLVFIDRKIPGVALPFEQVRDKIKLYLDEKVRRKAITQYITTLIAAAKIEGFQFDVDANPLMQ